jgi:CBS-domain-containing membrane protein
MVRYRISGLPVVDGESALVGIVTEADVMTKIAYGGTHRRPLALLGDLLRGHERQWEAKAAGLTAGQIMTTEVETARPNESVQAAARRMVRDGVKRLPVVDNDRVVGIVSRADVVNSMRRSDEELQANIAAVLTDPLRMPEAMMVDVSVNDGIVTLSGSVPCPMDLPVLSAVVWRIPGVVDVRVDVTARGPDPQPPPQPHGTYAQYPRFFR